MNTDANKYKTFYERMVEEIQNLKAELEKYKPIKIDLADTRTHPPLNEQVLLYDKQSGWDQSKIWHLCRPHYYTHWMPEPPAPEES